MTSARTWLNVMRPGNGPSPETAKVTGRRIVSSAASDRGGHARPRGLFAPKPRDSGVPGQNGAGSAQNSGTPSPPGGVPGPLGGVPGTPGGVPGTPGGVPGPLGGVPGQSGRPAEPGRRPVGPERPGTQAAYGPSGPACGSQPGCQARPSVLARDPASETVAHRRTRHRRRRRAGYRPGHGLRLGAFRGARSAGVPVRLAAAAVRRRERPDHGRVEHRQPRTCGAPSRSLTRHSYS